MEESRDLQRGSDTTCCLLTCPGWVLLSQPPQLMGVINYPNISAETDKLVRTTEQGTKAIRHSSTFMQMLI